MHVHGMMGIKCFSFPYLLLARGRLSHYPSDFLKKRMAKTRALKLRVFSCPLLEKTEQNPIRQCITHGNYRVQLPQKNEVKLFLTGGSWMERDSFSICASLNVGKLGLETS